MEGFQIQQTYIRSGHFCVDVEFFQPDGTHWGFTTFVMQGREGGQHPLVRHVDGRPLMDNGQPQPVRTQAQLDAVLAAAPNDTARAAIRRRFSVHSAEDAEGNPLYLEAPEGRARQRDANRLAKDPIKTITRAAAQYYRYAQAQDLPVGFDDRLPASDGLRPSTRDTDHVDELAQHGAAFVGKRYTLDVEGQPVEAQG